MDNIDNLIEKLNSEHQKQIQGLEAIKSLPKDILLEALKGLTGVEEPVRPQIQLEAKQYEVLTINEPKADGKTSTVLGIIKNHQNGIKKEDIRPLYGKARNLQDEDRIEREVTNSLSTLRKTNQIEMLKEKGSKGGFWKIK